MPDSGPAPSSNDVTFIKCPGQVNKNVNVVISMGQGLSPNQDTTWSADDGDTSTAARRRAKALLLFFM